VNYTLKNWPLLTRYLEKGFALMDNNAAGKAIRPFVVGRETGSFQGIPTAPRPAPACIASSKPPRPEDSNHINICAIYLTASLSPTPKRIIVIKPSFPIT